LRGGEPAVDHRQGQRSSIPTQQTINRESPYTYSHAAGCGPWPSPQQAMDYGPSTMDYAPFSVTLSKSVFYGPT